MDEALLTQGETSPFIPGTKVQYAWDSVSLGLLKTCPRKYQYTILDGWTSKHTKHDLTFGIAYHKALETFDRLIASGMPSEAALIFVVREAMIASKDWDVDPSTKVGKYKNRETLLRIVIDYIDQFRHDSCETYIKTDGTPAVELSFRFELDWGPSEAPDQPFILSGHLDRVVKFNGDLFVMDHKTTTTTPGDYYFNKFEPDNQMSLYTLAGGIVLHSPIRGVMIRAAQILLTAPTRFTVGFTYRTKDQLDEWLDDLRLLLNNAEMYAEIGYWPQNDTACDKYGGCQFREVCSKSPDVRRRYLQTDFIQLPPEERWNPLRSR